MKTRTNLKLGMLAVAMLAVCGSARAATSIDISVNGVYSLVNAINFQPGQELISVSIAEENAFARYLSSSLTMKVLALGVRGELAVAPPNTERVALFAEISAILPPASLVYSAQAGTVVLQSDLGATGGAEIFTQTTSQPYLSSIQMIFSEDASRTIVFTDSSEATLLPRYGYGPRRPLAVSQVRGSVTGTLALKSEYTVNYRVDSAFDRFLGWLDNVNATDFSIGGAIKRAILEHQQEKWEHATPTERKLFWRSRNGGTGIRGEVIFEGISVHTASPGVLVYTATLPDAPTMDVPLAFTQNNVDAVLDVAFDGQTLASFRGDDYLTDEINLLNIDISSFAGRTGELTFTINTSGPDSAEIFVAERLGGLKFAATSLTPVPEPGTWAMMLAGLAVMAGCAGRRRRKATHH